MTITRRLEDLFQTGGKVDLSDAKGPVSVFVSKINPLERTTCGRRASAAKAVYMRDSDDHNSDEWLATYSSVRDYGDPEQLITVILADDFRRARYRIEAELAASEEWSDEQYLQGLRDAWNGDPVNRGLKWRYAEEPNDPEAKRVFDELKRFDELANKEFAAEKEFLRDAWKEAPKEKIWSAATDAMLKLQADEVFALEHQRQQIYYGTFELVTEEDPETKEIVYKAGKRYFPTIEAVAVLDEKIHLQLAIAIDLLEVDAIEGKDSPAQPDSSPSSEPPETLEEDSEPSGLVDASA